MVLFVRTPRGVRLSRSSSLCMIYALASRNSAKRGLSRFVSSLPVRQPLSLRFRLAHSLNSPWFTLSFSDEPDYGERGNLGNLVKDESRWRARFPTLAPAAKLEISAYPRVVGPEANPSRRVRGECRSARRNVFVVPRSHDRDVSARCAMLQGCDAHLRYTRAVGLESVALTPCACNKAVAGARVRDCMRVGCI